MFDIDSTTLVVASVFISAVTAIFVYYAVKNKKAKAELLTKYNQFVSSQNLKTETNETWRNRFMLGLDTQSKTLVYCDFSEKEEKLAVPLAEVSKVVIHEVFRELENTSGARKTLENLVLKVQLKNLSKPSIHLPIYSADDYSDLLGETVIASNWATLINQQLTK